MESGFLSKQTKEMKKFSFGLVGCFASKSPILHVEISLIFLSIFTKQRQTVPLKTAAARNNKH